ncbi:multidrug effflux MFS transporter [Parapedobacter koreensis]|uniref:MFS transporter, DHA1 family, bicyclomycin/chloramphenicol resistance protein n=1 Tax=Parapedobacter koreensis TaxID=332977 RepID=A0A1H7QE83_9SPHI|nr:multidrug effflux MFS transporter [Parapedobacter koreensis]SEL46226.1 MFS transporter, DHA1 family, bicyclomycin/chloramphenicol resistance protein [Parapedobacter koreensis]
MAAKRRFGLILILGCLAALGPFSIDMYLPGFVDIAENLRTTEATVALSLSSFFIGISAGQLLYGPLLDKFGRKKPLYAGLVLYIVASFGCLAVTDVNQLIVLRFVQAIGSCATAVASIAMVRDLFTVEESPKVFASLMLVIAVSPMLAPTAGGYLIEALGWRYVFVFLGLMAVSMLVATAIKLPESYKPDPSYSLRPKPILISFAQVLREPQFYTYALISAFVFSGLFAYVSSSPVLFMKIYHLSKTDYGWIFAGLSVVFIGASQVNSVILRWFSSKHIVSFALVAQCIFSILFLAFAWNGMLNFVSTIVFIALFLCCLGFINPNAAALSMAPFSKHAGSASALMGAFQMALGAGASVLVSLFSEQSQLPMPVVMTVASCVAMCCLLVGSQFIREEIVDVSGGTFVGH